MARAARKQTVKAEVEAKPATVVQTETLNPAKEASHADLNKRSLEFGRTAKEFNEMLHSHLMNIARHIDKFGDVRPATFLVQQVRGGAKRSNGAQSVNAIIKWFVAFGGCTWNAQGDKFGRRKGDQKFNEGTANENPFYEFMPEAEFQPIDSVALLAALVGRLHKAMKDEGRKSRQTKDGKKDNINPDLVSTLDIILAKVAPNKANVAAHSDMGETNVIPVSKTDDMAKIVAKAIPVASPTIQ